jgi:hypothetical protein
MYKMKVLTIATHNIKYGKVCSLANTTPLRTTSPVDNWDEGDMADSTHTLPKKHFEKTYFPKFSFGESDGFYQIGMNI